MTATPSTTKLGPEEHRDREADGWSQARYQLIIDETAGLEKDLRAELIRQASLTDASVEIVREHPELLRHDGVAATLRYRR